MECPDSLGGYAAESEALIRAFESLQTLEILAPVEDLLPIEPSRILDVGAGTGRDAAWFAGRGHEVLAVEPVKPLREAGIALHPSERIDWLDDRLPALARLRRPFRFDLVLVIGVWQHLPPPDHKPAMAALARQVAPGGRLIISLRHGPGAPNRPCFAAEPDRIIGFAGEASLNLCARRSAASIQAQNRALGVTWTWLCLERD